jgi:hypothetical protein
LLERAGFVEVAMRQFESIPHSEDIVHPRCAKCAAPMWLTRIEPDESGSEKRTFECQACQNEAIEIVKFRQVARWLCNPTAFGGPGYLFDLEH